MILSAIAATAIVFSLSRAVGDPLLLFATSGYGISTEAVAEIRKELALDRAYPMQYLLWLGRVLRGDLGQTLAFKLPVARIITEKIPNSLQLGSFAWFFAGTIGVSLGVLSAVKRASLPDYAGRFLALIGQSVPIFWFAIILIYVFAVWLDWLPAGLAGDSTQEPSLWQLEYLVLPVTAMTLGGLAGYLRLTRSAMLEVLDSEYVKLARAKGVATSYRGLEARVPEMR